MRVDINCDMGESFGAYRSGDDEKIMPSISSANIACGWHAGDPMVMAETVRLAAELGVAIGAHPGYPDLLGYGRRNMETLPGEIRNYLLYQIGALCGFLRGCGMKLQHVKPHGALYNLAARDEKTANEVISASLQPDLFVPRWPSRQGSRWSKRHSRTGATSAAANLPPVPLMVRLSMTRAKCGNAL